MFWQELDPHETDDDAWDDEAKEELKEETDDEGVKKYESIGVKMEDGVQQTVGGDGEQKGDPQAPKVPDENQKSETPKVNTPKHQHFEPQALEQKHEGETCNKQAASSSSLGDEKQSAQSI